MPSKLIDYDILGQIGSGSYGTCKKIRRRSDNKVKCIFMSRVVDHVLQKNNLD